MVNHLRRNAVAYAALFVALGGTSYAAVTLPRDSVGTRQLQNGAVTGPKVKAHSLRAADFLSGSLPAGPAGPAGAQGPAGTQGPAGAQGPTGPAGLSTSALQDDLPAATASGTLSSAVAIKTLTVTLSSSGTLLVLDPEVESLSINNPTGASISYASVGLYLDGNPITDGTVSCTGCSVMPLGIAIASNIQLPDLSIPGVSAGTHTLTMALSGGPTTDYVTAASTRMVVLATG